MVADKMTLNNDPSDPPDSSAPSKRTLKNVTIRGIDASVYQAFSQKVQSFDMTIGDAITQLMTDVVKDFDDIFPTLFHQDYRNFKLGKARISHHRELTIGKSDLVDASAYFGFEHIDHLTLDPSVDLTTLLRYIRYINHCSTVYVPSHLPKLLVYSKVNFCDNIEFYDVKDEA